MKIIDFMDKVHALNIEDFIGVPDSTLSVLCDYLNANVSDMHHFVPVNEGAAVALAAGIYLGDKKISCVYLQNSGIGNAINPIASLMNEKVYDIPVLLIVGFRGEPGIKDEPQHKFQGEITLPLLQCMDIDYALVGKDTTTNDMDEIFIRARKQLELHKQFAIVVKKGTFEKDDAFTFDNHYTLGREEAIKEILAQSDEQDIIVSTTGKISREVYEQCDALFGNHKRAFLTVGSMGHTSMIALGIALKNPDRHVYCIDGDGAALMHMGSMAFTGQQQCSNLIHITLNNQAHESVGGMPTNCKDLALSAVANACGYTHTFQCNDLANLNATLQQCKNQIGPNYIEVHVSLGARDDLGRPKESAVENKNNFMEHINEWRK